jgi:hypothetical protein
VNEPAILLVTCCLEPSRYEVAKQVFANIRDNCPPEWVNNITVFDNASTYLGVGEIRSTFQNVYRADHNVGYWSAIDWWLNHLEKESPWPVGDQTFTPKYTYIIESDMIHYGAHRLADCVKFLDAHDDIGSVRLHEYSIENMRFYNKDAPIPGSRSNLWQSHVNKATGQSIVHNQVEGPFWRNNFLTQLPALNRFATMKKVFDLLAQCPQFTEFDFQQMYHVEYPEISIIDGGIFNCDLNPYGTKVVTGSWTDPKVLKQLGYQNTRFASIAPRSQYTVTRLS